MINLLILAATIAGNLFSLPSSPPADFIDPTGTYILKGSVTKNRIMGHSGELRVKLLDQNRIVISFYISRGYPGYESGSFTDTLSYAENLARYTPAKDPDCSILFHFSARKVETEQTYVDPHCHCGFEKDVMISAVFEKRSAEEPIIQDLSAHGTSA